MSVSGIKRIKVVISLPPPAYRQLQKLAQQTGQSVPSYIRRLVIQHLIHLGLPIYAESEE